MFWLQQSKWVCECSLPWFSCSQNVVSVLLARKIQKQLVDIGNGSTRDTKNQWRKSGQAYERRKKGPKPGGRLSYTSPDIMSRDVRYDTVSWDIVVGAYSYRSCCLSLENISLIIHPCDISNDARSLCRTLSAYATPLISGLSKAVLSAYWEKVSCQIHTQNTQATHKISFWETDPSGKTILSKAQICCWAQRMQISNMIIHVYTRWLETWIYWSGYLFPVFDTVHKATAEAAALCAFLQQPAAITDYLLTTGCTMEWCSTLLFQNNCCRDEQIARSRLCSTTTSWLMHACVNGRQHLETHCLNDLGAQINRIPDWT